MKYIEFSPLVLDKHNLGNTYKEFFDNKDAKNCPVDKCEVLQAGCKEPFKAGSKPAKYFSVLDAPDF